MSATVEELRDELTRARNVIEANHKYRLTLEARKKPWPQGDGGFYTGSGAAALNVAMIARINALLEKK